MEDLAGLNWTASTQPNRANTQSSSSGANYFPTLKPTPPVSGRSTPSLLAQQGSQNKLQTSSNGPSKSSTPANDSFANLLPFNAAQATKNVSLQEQQRLLQEQRAREDESRRRQWDTLAGAGSGAGSPTGSSSSRLGTAGTAGAALKKVTSPPTYSATSEYGGQRLSSTVNKPFASIQGQSVPRSHGSDGPGETEEDILAAFTSSAPVDSSTNFPVESESRSASVGLPVVGNGSSNADPQPFAGLDDDDPFGLGPAPKAPKPASQNQFQSNGDDEDDVLGLLGKPVSELPPRTPSPAIPSRETRSSKDKAVAELVDMGFSVERSKEALGSTENGEDVQAAVGWLLNQAHQESRRKAQPSTSDLGDQRSTSNSARPKPGRNVSTELDASMPAWMRQQGRSSSANKDAENRSTTPANGDRDPAKIAQELGNNLFKTANSLWKTGAKKLNKAVAEFNTENDSSQPKWMRETQNLSSDNAPANKEQIKAATGAEERRARLNAPVSVQNGEFLDMTDEAMMLEAGGGPPRSGQKQQRQQQPNMDMKRQNGVLSISKGQAPSAPQPKFMQDPLVAQARARINREALEEESGQAYVSPARRKKTPKPPSPEPDLLFGDSQAPTANSQQPGSSSSTMATSRPSSTARTTSSSKPQSSRSTPAPLPSRPKAPPRTIPSLSSIALRSSTTHRLAGNAAFKLGNYADATTSYSASLRDLPTNHPLTILLLTNRSLTHLKTGDPKASIADAESALEVIGPTRGSGEVISVGGEEGDKDMQPFWGKAMMRRAEALEQLERWADAASVWKECVEAGVGGSQSIQGRTRCERAINSSSSKARRPPPPSSRPKQSMSSKKPAPKPATKSSTPAAPAVAVSRLRAANAAAEKAEDEKFALADSVDARLAKWRKGKEGNLRALLGSLDTVLWEGSGWKKVGMAELIIPAKVKIAYMKGIGKVHPDKLPTTASTEQVMISGAVFSTLNEAWDRFKAENGL